MSGRVVAEEVERSTGHGGAGTDERDEWDQPVAKEEPHRKGIGCARRYEEGRAA
jgi:hypothetical protein